MSLDLNFIRNEFPALEQTFEGRKLIYLDSAATSLKPRAVINRITQFYSYEAANVHRGAYHLSDKATELYERSREIVAQFINASSSSEIVFVRGTTEGINLVASSFGESLQDGDEVIISDIEHHANIVPWQQLALKKGLVIKVLETTREGEITEANLKTLLGPRSKILAITHASNHLGNITPLKRLIELAKIAGVTVVVDGAQAVGKIHVDVTDLNADFYTFSGHKMFSPFGIGVVYGKNSLLQKMPPYQSGGSMIAQVSFSGTTFNDIPFRFEAGTPNIGGAIALAQAIQFIQELGLDKIESYENSLIEYMLTKLQLVNGLELLGPKSGPRIPVFAFNIEGCHASDIGHLLNQQGIAVRAGHHCTLPLVQKLNISGSVRASLSVYNTCQEIDALVNALKKAKELLR
jgi:cysteine desulfurase/selenocysteine lyase